MTKRVIRLTSERPLLDIFSAGRVGPSGRFTPAEVALIARTVRGTTEVIVKVTGGGRSRGGTLAHLDYITRKGDLALETDDGQRLTREEHRAFLDTWHLDLTAGQYRAPRAGQTHARKVKLTHNVVLSMPSSTPADKVLAAARGFAHNKFRGHRYAMVLHTDQKHPHVHLVVKAEHEMGKRLHIDKAMLQDWREHFAELMRQQGIAANATRRAFRGKNKRTSADKILRAQKHGKSRVLAERVISVAKDYYDGIGFDDPAQQKLREARKSVVAQWMTAADILDAQGEVSLAGDVRYFANHQPTVLTDRQQLAVDYILHCEKQKKPRVPPEIVTRQRRRDDFTR
jgi:hypothetical protein